MAKRGSEPITLKELQQIQQLYFDLIKMAGVLAEFEDKHDFAEQMKGSLDNCIASLSNTAHEITQDVFKMKRENSL